MTGQPAWIKSHIGVACLIGVFALFCYATTLGNTFLAEDITQAATAHLQLPYRLFPQQQEGYRPLMYVLWYVGDLLWGYRPFPYRLAVLAFHALNGLLLYALARRLGAGLVEGLFASLLFVALPTSAQAVNWLSAASNLTPCVFGYLLGLWAYLGHHTGRQSRRGLAVVGMLVALGSSELALLWPLAAFTLGLGLRLRGDHPAPPRAARYLGALRAELGYLWPLLLAWLAFVALRTLAVQGVGGYGAEQHLRTGLFLIGDLWAYLGYLFDPLSLAPGPAAALVTLQENPLLGAAALIGLAGLLWPARYELLAAFWMLLPALNIPAPHRAYLAGAGLALALALAGHRWLARAARVGPALKWGLIIAGCGLIGLAVAGSAGRNAAWTRGSDWARQVLSQTVALAPQPADGTRIYYANLPSIVDGTYVFTWGLPQAVQAAYANPSVHAYQVSARPVQSRVDQRLEATVEDIARQAGQPQVFLLYRQTPAGAPLISRVSRDAFVAALESAP